MKPVPVSCMSVMCIEYIHVHVIQSTNMYMYICIHVLLSVLAVTMYTCVCVFVVLLHQSAFVGSPIEWYICLE